jgi:glutamate-5-semialdehyde dehydrogenase
MNLQQKMSEIGDKAVRAAHKLLGLQSESKKDILGCMADEIEKRRKQIKAANDVDMKTGKENGMSNALLDRLELTEHRIDGMVQAILKVADLDDPIGEIISEQFRPNGLIIKKVRVPIGVIGVIFESRPNVTVDAATLCIKSSNAVILRGGTESFNSNKAIVKALQDGGFRAGLPENSIQFVPVVDRDAVRAMVQMEGKIDVIIPRGGENLIRAVTDMARIPVLKHYKGVCHIYIDEKADFNKAIEISLNAKCQRPGVCNALETLLVHKNIAKDFLPHLADVLKKQGVELRGDTYTQRIIPDIISAKQEDWYTEYLDLILAIKTVPDLQTAVNHINKYGSKHSDAIITENKENQDRFIAGIDSAAVYVNASTRFTDGGEFGMGAEMGISTDKLHARGPVGLKELTTYKYIIIGNGHIRE